MYLEEPVTVAAAAAMQVHLVFQVVAVVAVVPQWCC
jgi:hypothetical protein